MVSFVLFTRHVKYFKTYKFDHGRNVEIYVISI